MTQSSTSRMSISKAHQRVVDLDWAPTYAEQAIKYSTDYRFPKTSSKDSMKQILRSYFPMQEEKDNRVYAALDSAVRGNMFQTAHPRYTEWMKLFVGVFPFIEAAAARSMTSLANVHPSPEVRNGLMFQMIDEVRHTGIQQNLGKWYAQNYIDPAGFDASQKVVSRTIAGTFARQFAEGFITGDPVTASCIYLQVVAETAFTNVLFVANPSIAARNGDYVLPSVFMSVQSDESRHINNGYSTLLMVLQDPANHPLIERDLRYAFWQLHAIVDAAMGLILDYGSKNRQGQESYVEMWKRWVYDDYYRTYLIPMEK
jgi:propane monooxygenase large subunit